MRLALSILIMVCWGIVTGFPLGLLAGWEMPHGHGKITNDSSRAQVLSHYGAPLKYQPIGTIGVCRVFANPEQGWYSDVCLVGR